jgi:transcriptional regulator with GAF, ATPase, and Fis domain
MLRNRDGAWSLEDCSRNGILVDGNKMEAPQIRLERSKRYQLSSQFGFEWIEIKEREKTQVSDGRLTELVILGKSPDGLKVSEAVLIDAQGLRHPIQTSNWSMGRHPSNDIVFQEKEISLFHARISVEQNAYWITDLGSTNGLFVDGIQVSRAILKEKHQIALGPIRFDFEQISETLAIPQKDRLSFFGMQSRSSQMRRVFDWAESIAPVDIPVLITGETGTGKELVANAIHQLSTRSASPLVTLNCAALPKELAETELFGHEKGAFTNAHQQRKGAFERAQGGSLFLDEVAELDLSLQAKLLRVLETGDYHRVGGEESLQSQVRIIAATHKSLEREVEQGRFRADLFYRLNVLPLEIPSLRDRKEDLSLLCESLLLSLNMELSLHPEAFEFLETYPFPGNIRELRNILTRAGVSARSVSRSEILLDDLHFLQQAQRFQLLQNPKEQEKRREIERALMENNFSQTRTARALKLPISTLHDRMKKLGIETKKRACAPLP